MGCLIVRSKLVAILGATLILASSCTSSGDASESGPTTSLATQGEAASPTIAVGSIDSRAIDESGRNDAIDSNTDAGPAGTRNDSTDNDSNRDDSMAINPSGDDGTRTDIEPDGFDDGTVLADTDGIFDEASVSVVILECAADEEAACGNLGGRLARADLMSESDRAAAICTAGGLLAVEGQSRLAGIITLSLLLSDAEPSISGPIETIRLALSGDPQLDSAIAAASANASLSC